MPKLSEEQQPVIDAIIASQEGDTILFDSVAGSGKTTTLVAGLMAFSENVDAQGIVAIAYNRQNGETLKERTEGLADASTFHSWLMRSLNANNFMLNVEGKDVAPKDRALNQLVAKRVQDMKYRYAVITLLNMAYNRGYRLGGEETMLSVLEKSSVYLSEAIDILRLLRYAEDLFEESLTLQTLSYDQVVYKYVVFVRENQIRIPSVRLLAIDEYQDFTWPMLEVIRLIQERTRCRVLIGGDANQGIYAFRGAGIDPMMLIHTMFDIKYNFVVTTSFRCSKAVAELARRFVPHFKALPNAKEGSEETIIDMAALSAYKHVGVVARYTTDLMLAAIATIRAGIPIRFNREDKISNVVYRLSQHSNKGAISKTNFIKLMVQKIEEVKKNSKASETSKTIQIDGFRVCIAMYVFIKDEGLTIQEFSERYLNSRTGPEFGTIHSMKGLEYDTIVVVNFGMMPYTANKFWECQQEINAAYVAVTRAKSNVLIYNLPAN